MVINRSLLLVRGKKPYATWANSFDDDGPRLNLAEHRKDANAYLVVDYTGTGDAGELVELHWEEIFEYELNAWMRDPATWPSNRTLRYSGSGSTWNLHHWCSICAKNRSKPDLIPDNGTLQDSS